MKYINRIICGLTVKHDFVLFFDYTEKNTIIIIIHVTIEIRKDISSNSYRKKQKMIKLISAENYFMIRQRN